MKLFIQNQYQDAIDIEISATDKVLDLKKMISTLINGIMVEDQVLKFRSKVLTNSDTIQASGVQANSVVELSQSKAFKIYIKAEDNRIHEVDVLYGNSVEMVKKTLNHRLKLEMDVQRLLFNGKDLKNDVVLSNEYITPGTTIDLMIINLNLQLNIEHRSGHVERISMKNDSTIAQLKQVILAKYKVPFAYQSFTYNGKSLDDENKTLADYNVEDLSEIQYRPKDIEIMINFASIGRPRLTLRALPIDTVGQVKDQIQVETKINKNVQQLIWNGKLLDNDAIISFEHIHNGSTLTLLLTVQNLELNIQIGPEERIQIVSQSTETVAQLKTKLFNETKIPIDQQILFVDNTRLQDDKMMVDYGLNESADIELQRKDSFDLFIQTYTSRLIKINAHKNDRISTIKDKIDQRLGIKPEHQRLLYGSTELTDDTLESYRIGSEDTIHLVSRVPGGAIYIL